MRKNQNKRNWNNITLKMMVAAMLLGGLTGCGGAHKEESAGSYISSNEAVADQASGSYDDSKGFSSYNYSEATKSDERADDGTSYDEDAGENAAEATSDVASSDASSAVKNSQYEKSEKKIIKRYNYSYETEKFDDAFAYLKSQIEAYNGYISSSEINGRERRNLYLEARIPSDFSDEFVSQLGNLGTVVSQSESAEDVTLRYADTESRIASLKTEQERLLALLDKADSLENIIVLEDRLTEVRYELENYESQRKLYDDLVTYSTVTIHLSEVNYTVEVDESTILSRITTGLKRSLRDIGYDTVEFIIAFIIALPYLIEWAIIIAIIVLIVRLIIRGFKKRKMKKMQKQGNYEQPVQTQTTVEQANFSVNTGDKENNKQED